MDPTDITRVRGLEHIARGWAVFLLATDGPEGKIPPKNCARCDVRTGERHDREMCDCLLCHGFYAATKDTARFERMLAALPSGYLAVRTGTASRLLVLDVETAGLEVLDQWEAVTAGQAGSLARTLVATSVSGGRHLFYSLPERMVVRSGRVLPDVDVKAEGGLVGAVGSRSGKRVWLDESVPVAPCPPELLAWLSTTRRSGSGGGGGGERPDGYDYDRFLRDGCPGGHRNYFMNDLLFRARKRGAQLDEMRRLAYEHWLRVEQPPSATYEMLWTDVEYQVERLAHNVDVGEDLSGAVNLLRRWQEARDTHATDDTSTYRLGRATIVRQSRSRRGW